MKNTQKRLIALLLAAMMVFSLIGCSNSAISQEKEKEAPAANDTPKTEDKTQTGDAALADTNEQTDTPKEMHIGFLIPDTGSQSIMGALGRAAQEIAYEYYGVGDDGIFANRKLVLHIEDTTSDAAVGTQKAQKLVEEYGCEVIVGPLSGSVATAVKEYAGTQPNVTFIMNGGGDTMTYGTVYENVYRLSVSGAQASFAQGQYAAEQGYKKVLTVAPDNDFQYSWISGFKYTFIPSGGEVVSFWFPESGNDYSSLISQIPEDIDAILIAAFGSASADFIKQMQEFGYSKDIPIFTTHSAADLSTLGNQDLAKYFDGAITATHTPYPLENNEYYSWFCERHEEKLGYPISIMTMDPYNAFVVLFETLKAVDGNTDDLANFRKVMAELEFETPVGMHHFDENRQVVLTEYLAQVYYNEELGSYAHKILKEYENVSQFGPYDPEWFAAQPLPDRVNPTVEAINSAVLAD